MNITADLIKDKTIAGKDSDGKPIVMVETHGGLFACFRKSKGGGYETLAAAPHRAIAMWMAEKKDRGIEWKKSDELSKSEQTEAARFGVIRSVFFAPARMEKTELSGIPGYFVYDVHAATIDLMTATELKEAYQKGEILPNVAVRRTDLTDAPSRIDLHPDFVEVVCA